MRRCKKQTALIAAAWLAVGAVACSGGDTMTAPSNPSGGQSSGGSGTTGGTSTGVQLADDFGGRSLFPSDNWWNQDISNAPVDPQSDAYIDYIGRTRTSHPDFGPPPYGIPYVTVGGGEARRPVTFIDYGSESDTGFRGEAGYPIPDAAKTQPNYIEGGAPGGGSSGDRHMLIVDRDKWVLFELFATRWNGGSQRWEAGSGAVYDLSSTGDARKVGRQPMLRAWRFSRVWFASMKRCEDRFDTRIA